MKRIVILCDGTWNKVDSLYPTNVVRLAQAMQSVDYVGVTQVPIYVPGVGTGKGVTAFSRWSDKYLGGMFGWGLLDNIAAAYQHLVFLYEPGDEIYIFGFSRGAYTARSLTGLIRSTGIISRDHLYLLPEAIRRYRIVDDETTHPDSEESHQHRLKLSPLIVTSDKELKWRLDNEQTVENPQEPSEPFKLTITHLGVWDSVGALGVPRHLSVAGWFSRKKYQFHDADLSSMVESARHAIALDERRRTFEPTRWTNLQRLQRSKEGGTDLYQEKFLLGDHGSVGGGGDILALSSIGLSWILEGAQTRGLAFKAKAVQGIAKQQDPLGSLRNTTQKPSFMARALAASARDRKGPSSIEELHPSVLERLAGESRGPQGPSYNPGSLALIDRASLLAVAEEVVASDAPQFQP